MSVCALEIMENNNMIQIKNKYLLYKITGENYNNEKDIIKKIKIPYKEIEMKTGGQKFDDKFRILMKQSGYICTPAWNYADSEKFIKKSDVENFLKELPEIEEIYMKELCWIASKYIKEKYEHIRIKEVDNRYKNNLFKGNYITKITNINIKQNRIENAKQKEQEAIEFMEQLFK